MHQPNFPTICGKMTHCIISLWSWGHFWMWVQSSVYIQGSQKVWQQGIFSDISKHKSSHEILNFCIQHVFVVRKTKKLQRCTIFKHCISIVKWYLFSIFEKGKKYIKKLFCKILLDPHCYLKMAATVTKENFTIWKVWNAIIWNLPSQFCLSTKHRSH